MLPPVHGAGGRMTYVPTGIGPPRSLLRRFSFCSVTVGLLTANGSEADLVLPPPPPERALMWTGRPPAVPVRSPSHSAYVRGALPAVARGCAVFAAGGCGVLR